MSDLEAKARELAAEIIDASTNYSFSPHGVIAFAEGEISAALQSAHAAGKAEGLAEASQDIVCGACGQPWTGEKCCQANNGWPHEVCYPHRTENAAHTEGEAEQNNATRILRQSYITLGFAFRRLHESARSRDGELCSDFGKVRAEIEKHFKMMGVKL